jgi:hypothetical protein
MGKAKLASRLDWNRLLGFEQIVDTRETIAMAPKVGTKTGLKLGQKTGNKVGLKLGAKQGVKVA